MHLTRTYKLSILSCVLALCGVGALGLLWYGVNAKRASIEERAAAWVAAEERRTQLDSLLALVDRTKESRAELETFMLTNESVIDFLSNLERTARERGLTVTTRSLTVEPIEKNETFESLALSVEVVGGRQQVHEMLALIETLPQQVTVRQVAIDRVEDREDGVLQWRGLFDIRVTKYK